MNRALRILFFLFLFSLPVGATTYYVTTTGGGTACTSGSPCGTIQQGINTAHGAGNVLIIGAGTYNESPTVSAGGSSGNPFIVQGFSSTCPATASSDIYSPTGSRPNPGVTTNGWTLSGSYVRVDCFRMNAGSTISGTADDFWNNYLNLANTSAIGVAIRSATNCTIQRNYIYRPREGTEISGGSGCLISDNEYNGLQLLGVTNSGSDMDYNRLFTTYNITYRHNYMHDSDEALCGVPASNACHTDCLQTWLTGGTNPVHDITFDRNVCFHGLDGIIMRDTVSGSGSFQFYNITVTNNLMGYKPGATGWDGWCIFWEHVGTSKIQNNTCVYRGITVERGSTISSFQNNILYHVPSMGFGATPPGAGADTCSGGIRPLLITNGSSITAENHNFLESTCGAVSQATYPNDTVNVNPLFINSTMDCSSNCGVLPNLQNLNLQSTSPARGAGATGLGVIYDLVGYTRPSPPAIGAFEYQSGPGVPGVLFNPTALNFGSINVGNSSSAQLVTLTNTGNATLNVLTNGVVTSTQYGVVSDCGTAPFSLSAGANCHYNLTFNPSSAGTDTTTYRITDNAAGSPHTFSLTGTGINPNSISYTTIEPCGPTVTLSTSVTDCPFTTPGPGRLLNAVVQFHPGMGNNAAVLTALADNVQSWVIVPSANAKDVSTGADDAVGQWYVSSNLGGETVLHLTANQTAVATVVLNIVSNVNNVDQVCVASTQSTSTTANGCSVTTGYADEFISSAGWYNGGLTGTLGAPFSLGYWQSAGMYMQANVSSTGTYNTSWPVTGPTTFDSSTVSFGMFSGTPPNPQFSPTGLSFPNTFTGNTSAALTTTLTNTGGSPMTISSITKTGSDFTGLTNVDCPIDPSTLGAAASCHISIQFLPATAGNKSGQISVADDAAGSPHTASLSGLGVTPPAPSNLVATPGGVPVP